MEQKVAITNTNHAAIKAYVRGFMEKNCCISMNTMNEFIHSSFLYNGPLGFTK